MKIISIANVFGDFKSFDELLKRIRGSEADVLTISGNLNGNHFTEDERRIFYGSYQTLMGIAQQVNQTPLLGGRVINAYDAAQLIRSGNLKMDNQSGNGQFIGVAENYLELSGRAEKRMAENYKQFGDRFNTLEQKVFLVPGNLDTKFMEDILPKHNLHMKHAERVNGTKFTGYGESREMTPDVPQQMVIGYDSEEQYNHLSSEDGEVVLTHTPPTGYEGDNAQQSGDALLLMYMYRKRPDLIISGHPHQPYFHIDKDSGTAIANPGIFGRYGIEPHGTFMEIDLNEKTGDVHCRGIHQIKD